MRLEGLPILWAVANALPQGYPSVSMHGVEGTIQMPLVGHGTWQYSSSTAEQAVVDAFSLGYRLVDTAYVYYNHVGVGRGLVTAAKANNLTRDDYFVTSKVPGDYNESATLAALEDTLSVLGLDYVDLMLIHWPSSTKALRQEQWLTMEKWAKQGKARAIGVSHHCRVYLEEILAVATLPIALNQNQYHVGMAHDTQPRLHDKAFNDAHDILYMSYSPLCGPCTPPHNTELIDGDLVTGIGKKHNKNGAQVSLRWLVQQNIPVIPKSINLKHLASDFDIFDFELTPAEMDALSAATSPPETGTTQKPDDAQDCSFEETTFTVV